MADKLIYSDVNPRRKLGLDYYADNEQLLTILPYYEMKKSFRDRLLKENNQQAVKLKDIISIARLFKELYCKIGSYKLIKDNQLRYLTYDLPNWGEYQYFNQRSVDYVVEFINQIDSRLINLSPKEINDEVIKELAAIYKEVRNGLKERGLVTKWQAYKKLLAELKKEDFTYFYPDIKELFFFRLQIIKPVELELILKLSQFVEDTCLILDYNPDKPKLFNNLTPVVKRLKEVGFTVIDKRERDNQLIKELFSDKFKLDKYNWQQEMGTELEIKSREEPVEELKLAARKIVELAKKGQNLNKVGLAFSSPRRYIPHLERIFSQYNIPYQQSFDLPLASSPLIEDFKAVIELISSRFSADDLLTIAGSEFLELNYCGSLFDKLTEILKKVRFEAEGWQLIELIGEQKEAGDELIQVLEFLQANCRQQPAEKLNFKQFRAKLEELLTKLGWADSLREAKEEVEAAWQALKDQINSLKDIIDGKRKLKEWLELIRLVISEGTYTPHGDRGVDVTGKIELRSGDYDYIFLIGLSHDLYPAMRNNPVDKYLRLLGIKLDDREVRDRYLLADHLLAANKGVYITYSKEESEDKPLSSSCLEELARLVELEEIEITDKIYSVKELQEAVGADLKEGKLNKLVEDYSWGDDLALKARLTQERIRKELSGYNGSLEDQGNINLLQAKFNDSYNYSASLLEEYLGCPFKFLFSRVFELEDIEYEEEINPLERGNMIHKIMEKFHAAFTYDRVTKENYQQAYQTLLEVAKEVINKRELFDLSFYWQTERDRYLQGEKLGVVLEEFLEEELEGDLISWYSSAVGANEFKVKAVEWEFSNLELIPGHLFQGKIDRINYHPKEDCLAVIDYKTGKLRYKRLKEEPIQLPLYMMAADEEFAAEVSFGGYFGLHPDEKDSRYKMLLANKIHTRKQKKFEDNLEQAKELIKEAVAGIKRGEFTPGENSNCDWCQCKYICRKGDQ